MAQYIKINSQVFNADTFIAVTPNAFDNLNPEKISIITTSTFWEVNNEVDQDYWQVTTGSAAEASALTIAINAALTANPGGRVIEVPPSNDYTISSIVLQVGS